MIQAATKRAAFSVQHWLYVSKTRRINCTIYESRPEDDEERWHIGLVANGLRVLDHVCVYVKIRNQGFNSKDLHLANASETFLGSISQGNVKNFTYPVLRIRRSIVRQELITKAKESGIRIVYDKSF